ncbi:hypothetical protein BC938DRAFT_482233 [Jimgerdemannia flammicorona]|uniref:Zn(2)-C6 fungal-type domain-containing protein n=1 Tax=Jimgerdemannia flammicorona TaxID=994334 RepID=A0A433QEF4_9FUNG|nr:hypothetical protein BC938DRAFT_482233 [Jimgerdemannia flammicorona]
MDSLGSPYNYRSFQQVWDATKPGGRARAACSRCRERRSKCDGHQPCGRCRHIQAECVYLQHKVRPKCDSEPEEEEDTTGELLREVLLMEQNLTRLNVELVQMRKGVLPVGLETPKVVYDYPSPPCSDIEDDEREGKGHCKSSEVILSSTSSDIKPPWLFTLTKKGIHLEFKNARQLYELLAYIASPSRVYHDPAGVVRPVGTQAMSHTSSVLWCKWGRTQILYKYGRIMPKFPPNPRFDPASIFITPDIEENWLNVILLQTVHCSSPFGQTFSERFLAYNHTKKPKSPYQRALYYAMGALNAQHVIMYHPVAILDLATGTNTIDSNFGRELGKIYFAKARELLAELFLDFESDPSEQRMDMVDALHAMAWYAVNEGDHKLASTYFSMALRVATQLNYHKALRGSDETVVGVEELRKALMWNLLASTDQSLAKTSKRPGHSIPEDTRLNLLSKTIRPAHMPDDNLHRLHWSFFIAKHSAICEEYLDAWWGENSSNPTIKDLDRFVEAFDHWSTELPANLRVDTTDATFRSLNSFILAVNLQLHHSVTLADLYSRFLPSASSLPADLANRVESACSDAALTATKLTYTYHRVGGCMFPITSYVIACEVHVKLAKSMDKEIAKMNRACLARALRMFMETREFALKQRHFVGLANYLANIMKEDGIETDEDILVLGEEDYFVPVKTIGVGW